MKRTVVVMTILAVLAAVPLARAQAGAVPETEKEAAIRAALDYSDGAYSGDAARMERAIHPDLNKLIFYRRSPSMGLMAGYSTWSDLVELTRTAMFIVEPEKRMTETAVLEITDDVACLRVKTSAWCDYLQMIKVNGRWKIVNVLWTRGLATSPEAKVVPGFDPEKERPAARQAVLDLILGRFAGDAPRVEKVLHPETSQLLFFVAAKTKGAFVTRTRYSGILEPVKAKLGAGAEDVGKVEARVLDLMDGMAFAAATLPAGAAYLQLQLMDGQWKVINILSRPTDNSFPPAPPAKK
jgi:Putative lumazine-binding